MCHCILSANELLSVAVSKLAFLRRSPEVLPMIGRVFVSKTSAKRLTFSALAVGGAELKMQSSGSMVQQHGCLQPSSAFLLLR